MAGNIQEKKQSERLHVHGLRVHGKVALSSSQTRKPENEPRCPRHGEKKKKQNLETLPNKKIKTRKKKEGRVEPPALHPSRAGSLRFFSAGVWAFVIDAADPQKAGARVRHCWEEKEANIQPIETRNSYRLTDVTSDTRTIKFLRAQLNSRTCQLGQQVTQKSSHDTKPKAQAPSLFDPLCPATGRGPHLRWRVQTFLVYRCGYTNDTSLESCDTLLGAWCVGHSGRKAGASHFSCHMIHQLKGHVHAKTFLPWLWSPRRETEWTEKMLKICFHLTASLISGRKEICSFSTQSPRRQGRSTVADGKEAITCYSSLIRLTSDAAWVTRQLIK
ncbi:uncharacterized protein LOC120611444 [Pteropus medius]|uniref:uncharacterized protein LOC120611444 n=1 Tax=Pteropus vampyrus TaxID=132908 RepID=UPI00196B4E21|nr:uncharacterized protein LOC120611444 [Pteropus giganteus]